MGNNLRLEKLCAESTWLSTQALSTQGSKHERRLGRLLKASLTAPCAPALCILALCVLYAPALSAQNQVEDEFSVQRFNPAPGPRNFITTRGVRSDGEMAFSAGLFANYAYKPFVIRTCVGAESCDDVQEDDITEVPVVENLVTGDLVGSLTPIPRLQVGLRIPVTWVKGQGVPDETGEPQGISAVGLGDIEAEGKYRLYGKVDDPFVVGAGLFLTAPLGTATSEGNYIGDASPTVGGRLIADGAQGPFSFGLNLIGVYRGSGQIGVTEIGPEFRYSGAAGFKVSPVFRVLADVFGASSFSTDKGENTLEADGGVQITPLDSPVTISAGAGAGIIDGVGSPTLRAFAGFVYVVESRDRDKDGLDDKEDQCPTAPEDVDGYQDSDGCPDPDNDLDAIADVADKCPMDPEDQDGFEDTDGCPEADNDKDGIPDVGDRCPLQPETKNNYKDEDGCPDIPDTDEDGVVDPKDSCPNDPEDTDGFQDTDGCPDPDNDNDGVPDVRDECIEDPETINEFEDEDGCPDEAP